jgi:hypothetical protein
MLRAGLPSDSNLDNQVGPPPKAASRPRRSPHRLFPKLPRSWHERGRCYTRQRHRPTRKSIHQVQLCNGRPELQMTRRYWRRRGEDTTRFPEGDYEISVLARIVNRKRPQLLTKINVSLTEDEATRLNLERVALFT